MNKGIRAKLRLLLLAGLLLAGGLAGGQTALLHLDKPFYVSGETAWYKVYLPPTVTQAPISVAVSVSDANGTPIDNFFLKSEGRPWVAGYYRIPYDWPAGYYQLTFTAYSPDLTQRYTLARAILPVYSDLQTQPPANSTEAVAGPAAVLAAPPAEELQIALQLNEEPVRARAEVRADLRVTDAAGQAVAAELSVSVIDWSLANGQSLGFASVQPGSEAVPARRLADTLFLAGQLMGEHGQPLSAAVLGGFNLDDGALYLTKAAEDGAFRLLLPTFYGTQSVQLVDYLTPYIKVQAAAGRAATPVGATLPFNTAIADYLESSRRRKKIYQLYGTVEAEVQPAVAATPVRRPAADRSFAVQDYQRFPDLATFMREVVKQAWFSRGRQGVTAHMYDPKRQKDFSGQPLLLVDGQVTRDADFVAGLSPAQLERVDIYYRTDRLASDFPAFGRNGIIMVHTLSGRQAIPAAEAADIVRVNGLQPPAAYPLPRAAAAKPLLRPQVYWRPDLPTDANGQAHFSYTQTDDWSTFRIEVVARAADGRLGRTTYLYTVGDQAAHK